MLNIKCRYFTNTTTDDIPCREENFERREIIFPFHVRECALVLVDVWDKHYIESFSERASILVQDKIVPVLDVARRAGMQVIHAPGADIVPRDRLPVVKKVLIEGWPPPDFVKRRGDYTIYRDPRRQFPPVSDRWRKVLAAGLHLSPLVQPLRGEPVIASADRLHYIAVGEGLLHFFYAGFATNWCVLNRDYGIRTMRDVGYNTMILRDATAGIEFPDTLEEGWATELAIREIEQIHGFSVSTDDFIAACEEEICRHK